MVFYYGAHQSISGGIDKGIKRAIKQESNFLQFFVSNPRSGKFKEKPPEYIAELNTLLNDNNMNCIEGEGLPLEDNNYLRGDLYINFIIEFPEKITDELKELLLKHNFTSYNDTLDDENEEFEIIQKNPSVSYGKYKSNLNVDDDHDSNQNHNDGPGQCAQQ